MKIQLVSDLHLEFEDINIKNELGADVLVLSGDICVAEDLYKQDFRTLSLDTMPVEGYGRAKRAIRYRDFFSRVSFQFPHVIYIMGNHEHYHGTFDTSREVLQNMLNIMNIHNVYILDNDIKDIDGVRFVGGTLWTDCNKGDPLTQYHLEQAMNDFRVIRVKREQYRKFMPKETIDEHIRTKKYISLILEETPDDMPVVVCGHHAPSSMSIAEQYKNDTLMNGGYYSDLGDFILDRPKIRVWTHGHMHQSFDYMIGGCRVVCNPRGYHDENRSFDPNFVVEV